MNLAFDGTARTIDLDGRLHISKSHISKAGVNPYYGREIPKAKELGLDPDKIYYLLRSPTELARAASSFALKPILNVHIPAYAHNFEEAIRDHVVGAIGSDLEYNHPYLDADLSFWGKDSIAGIESDTLRELSCAYRYVAVMTKGVYEGIPYDGEMTELVGNHLATVPNGRAGSDVLAADSSIGEITTVKMTRFGKALFTTLGLLSPKLAEDAAFPALVGTLTRSTIKKAELIPAIIALDAEMDKEKAEKAVDAVAESGDDPKMKPAKDKKAKDAHAEGCDCADCMKAHDEDDEEDDKEKKAKDKKARDGANEDDDEQAMDAAVTKRVTIAVDQFKADLRAADEARRLVRLVVGEVIAQDSAKGILEFALDHMKVDHKGVNEVTGLTALFNVAHRAASTPAVSVVAMDAAAGAAAIAKFPHMNRFKHR